MAYEFKLPDLGEGLTEGEIARWLVQEGQEVAEDDPLVEIQTDKTTVEIPSPAAGVISRISSQEGDVVPVGTVLVVIGEDGAARPSRRPRRRAAAPAVPVTNCYLAGKRCVRPRWCGGSPRSSASRSTPCREPGRRGGSPRTTSAVSAGAAPAARRHDASRFAGCAGSWPRTWPARIARSPRSPGSRSATSPGDLELLVPLVLKAVRRGAEGVPRAERAHRGRRARLPRPLRHRHRGGDRRRARRAGRARLRHRVADELSAEVARLAERPGREAQAGGAPRRRPSRSRAPASSPGSSSRR